MPSHEKELLCFEPKIIKAQLHPKFIVYVRKKGQQNLTKPTKLKQTVLFISSKSLVPFQGAASWLYILSVAEGV